MSTSLDQTKQVDHVGQAIKAAELDLTGQLTMIGGTVTLSSNAGTVSKQISKVTTESLTTAAGANVALVVTLSGVATTDNVMVQWVGGTNTQGTPIFKAVPTANTVTITIYNQHATQALNGTFLLSLLVIKAV